MLIESRWNRATVKPGRTVCWCRAAAALSLLGGILRGQLDASDQSAPSDSQAQGVSVLCVDADGKPVADAEVYLFQGTVGDDAHYMHFGPFSSDERGHITCGRTVFRDARGHYDRWVYARVPGRLVGVARSTNWKNRSPINPGFRVKLHPSKSVEGSVALPEGFDPTQVTVRVQTLHIIGGPGPLDYDSFPRSDSFEGLDTALADIFECHPDAMGRFRFNDVPVRGRLYLLTTGKGLGEAQWRNENNSFNEPIRLTINREGILAGRILLPDGEPAFGMKIVAQLSPVRQPQVFHLSTFRAVTDEHGQFSIAGLPQCPFVVSVEDPTHQWTVRSREDLSVAAGDRRSVMVSMEAGVLVSGRVLDSEGKPVEGASLSAIGDGPAGPGLAYDTTDRDGRYRLRLPSGTARLYFNALPPDFAYPEPQIVKQLDIESGQDAVEGLDVTVRKKGKQNDG